MSLIDHRATIAAHPTGSALRIGEYANPVVYERERARLFRPGTGLLYLDHDRLWSGAGVRRADGDPRLLMSRDGDHVRALANLCSHALRPLIDDDSVNDRAALTCPYHQWSYRRDGAFIGGPGCEFGTGEVGERERRALDLREFDTLQWHGMSFVVDGDHRADFEADLATLDASLIGHGIDASIGSEWGLRNSTDDHYATDWKIFLEVFGDCYHVPPFHEGLAAFADCDTLQWEFGAHFHAQYLKFAAAGGRPSALYERWADGIARDARARGDEVDELAVAWVAIYPNVMIEFYAGLRVISIVIPTGPNSFVNRAHFFVRADSDRFVPGLADTMIAAYHETAEQDIELVETRGRGIATARALDLDNSGYLVQTSGTGPEAGVAHFHDWWRRAMAQS
jgi:choline monooxygenase